MLSQNKTKKFSRVLTLTISFASLLNILSFSANANEIENSICRIKGKELACEQKINLLGIDPIVGKWCDGNIPLRKAPDGMNNNVANHCKEEFAGKKFNQEAAKQCIAGNAFVEPKMACLRGIADKEIDSVALRHCKNAGKSCLPRLANLTFDESVANRYVNAINGESALLKIGFPHPHSIIAKVKTCNEYGGAKEELLEAFESARSDKYRGLVLKTQKNLEVRFGTICESSARKTQASKSTYGAR